jgi:hypothetical protein
MKRILPLLLTFGALAVACPKQRADVKNLTDAAARQISAIAEAHTIEELNALARPSDTELKQRTEAETKRFRVTATIWKVESEADGDMKIFLSSTDGKTKLVAEVPETECVAKQFRKAVAATKKKLRNARTGTTVTLEGVGYWGYQRPEETATNGIQLHPVLAATFSAK